MAPEVVAVAKRLKLARQRAGLAQDDLARILDCPQSSICRYEAGKQGPSLLRIRQWAAACDVRTSWLLEVLDEMGNPFR
jgi:transcriptional regulator with XRE-family HTH domain